MAVASSVVRDALGYFHLPEWEGVELCVGDGLTKPLPLQFHDWFEIRLVLSGSASISIGKSQSVVYRGSLILIRPYEFCGVRVERQERFSFLSLCIDPAFLRKPTYGAHPGAMAAPVLTPVFVDPALAALLLALPRAVIEGVFPSQRHSLLHELIAEMNCRGLGNLASVQGEGDVGHPPPVQRAIALLRQHSAEKVPLDKLASAVGLSRFHFLRLFSMHLGVTPHRYQLLLRISRARALLRSGVPIAEAAADAGFYDQSHLTRCFHAIVGVPPRRFQC